MTAVDETYTRDDGLGGVNVYRGPTRIGYCWPAVGSNPEGMWWGKRLGSDAVKFGTQGQAVVYVSRADS